MTTYYLQALFFDSAAPVIDFLGTAYSTHEITVTVSLTSEYHMLDAYNETRATVPRASSLGINFRPLKSVTD
ncbi:MAG: hypothetical protein Tsb005_18980 [Gammaproteobacteria bacterium]